MDNFAKLPVDCISEILSLTSPAEVTTFSTISKRFKSASDSDTAWNKFVPSDIDDIISKSSTPPPFQLPPPSKKHLFLSLSDNPIVLDAGKKMFYLDKCSGQKCVMIAPAELAFFGTNNNVHDLTSRPEPKARFKEVAELRVYYGVFDICFKIPNQMLLSKETHYSCYLMYQVIDKYEAESNEYSDSTIEALKDVPILGDNKRVEKDGWEEIEIKSFFNNGANGDDDELRVSVGVDWSYEFIMVQGKFTIDKFPPWMMESMEELFKDMND
ncbi:unnamed protein product [Cuscuta epithymum]|uniref:F-box domain-containing protein n=1 Tax=Cuscuta epithymum TaxID=186058 RepID=A0AAV0F313_9ASTE|nr:unnamed protein product [Cuscuta epithymum]